MQNVLVVGGAGYIGSHCARMLAAQGYHPVVFDNLSCGHEQAVKWGSFFEGDILHPPSLADAFERFRPAAVFHFAARALVAESLEQPELYRETNVTGTKNLIEAMLQARVDRLVFSSTCAVYGVPDSLPIDEQATCHPINPYGETKLAAEELLKKASLEKALKFVSLRYFNAAGAEPQDGIGESHKEETHLIPLLLLSVLGRRPPLTIFGDDYPTPDGTAVRDYVHVSDIAQGHLDALSYLDKGGESDIFNLGTGCGSSILEIIQMAKDVTGREVQAKMGPPRAGDPPLLVAQARKAHKLLSWKPEKDLRRILADAWAWHSNQAF